MTQQWRVVFVGACLLAPAVSEPLVPATAPCPTARSLLVAPAVSEPLIPATGPCPTAGSLLVAETQLDVSPFDR